MRAGGLFRVMLYDGENLREGFWLVLQTNIVGHIYLDDYGWILVPWLEQVEHGSVSPRL